MEENEHTIFVGSKAFMNYVTGVVMQFTTQNADEVVVKARGKFISKAVDIAEVALKRFLENQIEGKDIKACNCFFRVNANAKIYFIKPLFVLF